MKKHGLVRLWKNADAVVCSVGATILCELACSMGSSMTKIACQARTGIVFGCCLKQAKPIFCLSNKFGSHLFLGQSLVSTKNTGRRQLAHSPFTRARKMAALVWPCWMPILRRCVTQTKFARSSIFMD